MAWFLPGVAAGREAGAEVGVPVVDTKDIGVEVFLTGLRLGC